MCPADDLTDPAPATTFTHLDATTVLSRDIASLRASIRLSTRWTPPPVSSRRKLSARSTTRSPAPCSSVLQRYKELQDIIAIMGMDELSEEDKLTVSPRPQGAALPVPALPCCGAVHRHARPVCAAEGDPARLQDDFERRVRQHPRELFPVCRHRSMMSWPRPNSSKAVGVWQLSRSRS